MKSIIESIWDNYQIELSESLTEGTKEILREASEKQGRLLESLDKEQTVLFEEYLESQDKMQNAADKRCFIDGVCFGIQFILDATTDNR